MTGLLICAAVVAALVDWEFVCRWNVTHGPEGRRAGWIGLILTAAALWLAWKAGAA